MMLTIREAAALVGVTPRTLHQWVAAGILPVALTIKPLRVTAAAVRRAAKSQQRARASESVASHQRAKRAYGRRLLGHCWEDIAEREGFADGSGAYRAARRYARDERQPWPPETP